MLSIKIPKERKKKIKDLKKDCNFSFRENKMTIIFI